MPDYAAALGGDLSGLTVGVPRHYFFSDEANLDPEVAEAVNRAIEALGELGATVRDIEIPSLAHATIANNVIMMSEAHAYHRKNLLSQPENFGDIVRTRFIYGAAYTAADYVQAQRARSRLRREFAEALDSVRPDRRDGYAAAGGGTEGLRPAGYDAVAQPDGAVQPDGAAVDVGAGGVLVGRAAHRHAARCRRHFERRRC